KDVPALRESAVIGEVLQEPSGLALTQVDITMETDKGEFTRTVKLKGERTPFELHPPQASARVQRVVLDKYGTAARANGGVFSILSFNPEQEQTLIVYGTVDEVATNREAAEAVQKAIRERWSNYTVPIKSDREVSNADLKSHHFLLIGRPD